MSYNRLPKSVISGNGISFVQRILQADYPYHWHEFYEIEYILDGEADFITNGIPFRMKKGSMTLLTPADFHEVKLLTENVTLLNIMFTDEWIESDLQKLLNTSTVIHDYRFFPAEKFSVEFSNDFPQNARCIRYLLNAVLIDITRSIKEDSPLSVYNKPVHNALTYIHQHFRENITLDDVASKVGFSPNYFSKVFCDNVGQPYVKYISDLKLSFAASLLISSDTSITDVSYRSGFNTFSHFQLCFKKKYGISPGQYRKSMQSEFQNPKFVPPEDYSFSQNDN